VSPVDPSATATGAGWPGSTLPAAADAASLALSGPTLAAGAAADEAALCAKAGEPRIASARTTAATAETNPESQRLRSMVVLGIRVFSIQWAGGPIMAARAKTWRGHGSASGAQARSGAL
jgi:hypothetical protein